MTDDTVTPEMREMRLMFTIDDVLPRVLEDAAALIERGVCRDMESAINEVVAGFGQLLNNLAWKEATEQGPSDAVALRKAAEKWSRRHPTIALPPAGYCTECRSQYSDIAGRSYTADEIEVLEGRGFDPKSGHRMTCSLAQKGET